MTLYLNSQQRFRSLPLVWFLSLLLFLSPLFTQAQWMESPGTPSTADVDMPCHMAEVNQHKHNCEHCIEPATSLICDCCDSFLTLSLVTRQTVFHPSQLPTEMQILTDALDFPDPPPGSLYRPPIQILNTL